MKYKVDYLDVDTNMFGNIKREKLVAILTEKFNALDKEGYEVFSVLRSTGGSNYITYQIFSKKKEEQF